MYNYSYPSWTVTVNEFSYGNKIEFKFLKKSSNRVTWESINNRIYTIYITANEYPGN